MSRRRGQGSDPGVPAVYEGPEVLTALLRKAGSPHAAEEVAERFQKAQAAGEPRSAVIPTLFQDEPRFGSPDEARRLYGNLFGLWARLQAGLGPHDDAPAVAPEPDAEAEREALPERAAQQGDVLAPDIVEGMWRILADASPRELQRRRDRFMNVQPDLAAWLESLPLADAAILTLQDLAFETWAMFDHAYGERLGMIDFRDLRDLEKEPPPLAEVQPALATYLVEQLDLSTDEDPAFDAASRAQVERALAAVAAALTAAVVEPS